ncbi:MAG: serine/threonine protein kinase [Planctomycetota bacterium]|nr:MAG: serine/threonine protein kinase [Planctomycetota bacterium]
MAILGGVADPAAEAPGEDFDPIDAGPGGPPPGVLSVRGDSTDDDPDETLAPPEEAPRGQDPRVAVPAPADKGRRAAGPRPPTRRRTPRAPPPAGAGSTPPGRRGLDPSHTATSRRARAALARAPAPVDSDDPLVGQVLEGRYRVLEPIGSGGMAVVYRAWHLLLEKTVALKLIHPQSAERSSFRERFYREARIASELVHENIIQTREFGETAAGHFYMLMDYSSGRTLSQVLEEEGPLPSERAVAIARQILAALASAHTRGVVHRDIKPQNIMVEPGDRVRLLDFGLAKLLGDADDGSGPRTRDGAVIGTPKYMSPEQALGQRCDHKADLYAVGVVLYELLSGSLPFPAQTSNDIMRAHVVATPRPLRSANPNLDHGAALEAVLARALAKAPADRWDSADAFARALEDSLRAPDPAEGEGSKAGADSSQKPGGRRLLRRLLPAVVGLAAVVGVALFFLSERLLSRRATLVVRTAPGARVELASLDDPAFRRQGRGDAAGLLVFSELPLGSYSLRARRESGQAQERRVELAPESAPVTLLWEETPAPPRDDRLVALMLRSLELQVPLCAQRLDRLEKALAAAADQGIAWPSSSSPEVRARALRTRLRGLRDEVAELRRTSPPEAIESVSEGLAELVRDLEACTQSVDAALTRHRELAQRVSERARRARRYVSALDRRKASERDGTTDRLRRAARSAYANGLAAQRAKRLEAALEHYERSIRAGARAWNRARAQRALQDALDGFAAAVRSRDAGRLEAWFLDPAASHELLQGIFRRGASIRFECDAPTRSGEEARASISEFSYLDRRRDARVVLTGYRVLLRLHRGRWKVVNVRKED